jgi:Cof subfamily protein (haloacid dehalogenase superfamily)
MVVSDMDGTLLNDQGVVTPRTAEALKRADAAGARVVIATGRPVWWLGPVIDAGFDGIAVCMNGAVVYDIAADEVLSTSLLTADLARQFVVDLERLEPRFALAVERAGTQLTACFAEESYDHPWADGIFQRVPRADLLTEPLAKLLVRGTEGSADLAAHARAAAGDRVAITYSTDDGLIEVAAPGVNKGATLDRLAASWGIDPAQVIAFGDMPNDLEMLAWAGHGVAMGNGHTEVHAVANEVIGLHHHDAVAEVLERWF